MFSYRDREDSLVTEERSQGADNTNRFRRLPRKQPIKVYCEDGIDRVVYAGQTVSLEDNDAYELDFNDESDRYDKL